MTRKDKRNKGSRVKMRKVIDEGKEKKRKGQEESKERNRREKREGNFKSREWKEWRKVWKEERRETTFKLFQAGPCIVKQNYLNPRFNLLPRDTVGTGISLHPDVSPNVFLPKRLLDAWDPSVFQAIFEIKLGKPCFSISIRSKGSLPYVS